MVPFLLPVDKKLQAFSHIIQLQENILCLRFFCIIKFYAVTAFFIAALFFFLLQITGRRVPGYSLGISCENPLVSCFYKSPGDRGKLRIYTDFQLFCFSRPE